MINFTNREIEIIKRLIDGKTNSIIADELFISVHTVKKHLENIFLKTNCHNRIQVIVTAIKFNYIDLY